MHSSLDTTVHIPSSPFLAPVGAPRVSALTFPKEINGSGRAHATSTNFAETTSFGSAAPEEYHARGRSLLAVKKGGRNFG